MGSSHLSALGGTVLVPVEFVRIVLKETAFSLRAQQLRLSCIVLHHSSFEIFLEQVGGSFFAVNEVTSVSIDFFDL